MIYSNLIFPFQVDNVDTPTEPTLAQSCHLSKAIQFAILSVPFQNTLAVKKNLTRYSHNKE